MRKDHSYRRLIDSGGAGIIDFVLMSRSFTLVSAVYTFHR